LQINLRKNVMKVAKIFLLALFVLCYAMGDVNAQKSAKPKKGVTPRKVNVPAVYRVDTDNDGVPDVRDQCPNTIKGTKVDDYGCPIDTDKDGVPDIEDKCPGTPGDAVANSASMGPKENNGCPWGDKDGDGILDNVDRCPDIAGTMRYFGCPPLDSDGDGVPDDEDECRDKKGPKSNRGCPENKDTDGDGLLDQDDACPEKPGPKDLKGCPPVITAAEEAVLRQASKIEFESGKATILPAKKKATDAILDKVVDILKSKPETFMLIEGHTDNVKPKLSPFKDNKELSEARAKYVMDYMISKGISANRLKAVGYGDTKPFEIDSPDAKPLTDASAIAEANKTAEQRANNRRVKMTISSVKLW
jgi:outer membrane protein OmpA-like peptidoglycan-associated protein